MESPGFVVEDTVLERIRSAIRSHIVDAGVAVEGGGGHYTVSVVSRAFAGKNMLESQRMVYRAIAHLMAGASAPVHAIDHLSTSVPELRAGET